MRTLALLALAACSHSSAPDPCVTKLQPLNQPGATAACTGVDAVSRAFHACVVAAVDTPGVAACLEPLRDAQKPHPPASDAGVVAADASAAPPLDPAKLPEIPVAAGGKPGEPVELFAIDVPTAHLIMAVSDDRTWHLAPAVTTKITGHLAAPSRAAAAAALGAAESTPPKGKGPSVDLQFAAAPQHDLFNLLGDILRTNLVVPGDLPPVDIVARRIPADAVVGELAKLDGRTIVRHANVSYLLPAGAKLEPLPKVSGSAKVTLMVRDATAADVMAALRAVAPVTVGACGTQKITFYLRDVKLAEALRAIAVAGGVPLEPSDRCPIADEPTSAGTSSSATTVAIAKSGGKTASTIVRGAVSTLVRDNRPFKSPIPAPPEHLADYLATIARTAAVIRGGTTWSALLETKTGEFSNLTFAARQYTLELPTPPVIDATGVVVNGVRLPLRRL
jgi:hypothetical protein